MKPAICLFAVVAMLSAGIYQPYNTKVIYDDSMRIDGTASKWTNIIWTDKGHDYAVLLEARDDSTAGFATDSANVKVEVYQAFVPTRTNGQSKTGGLWNAILLPSRGLSPDSSSYILWDSLDILQMDTAAAKLRGVSAGIPTDSIAAASTLIKGAYAYKPVNPDRVGGMALKLTGKLRNASRGVGAMWKIRVYEQSALMTKTSN